MKLSSISSQDLIMDIVEEMMVQEENVMDQIVEIRDLMVTVMDQTVHPMTGIAKDLIAHLMMIKIVMDLTALKEMDNMTKMAMNLKGMEQTILNLVED